MTIICRPSGDGMRHIEANCTTDSMASAAMPARTKSFKGDLRNPHTRSPRVAGRRCPNDFSGAQSRLPLQRLIVPQSPPAHPIAAIDFLGTSSPRSHHGRNDAKAARRAVRRLAANSGNTWRESRKIMTAIHVLAAMKPISGDCGWRSITDEGRAFGRKRAFRKQPVGQISKSVSSPDRKNIPLSTSSVDASSSPRPAGQDLPGMSGPPDSMSTSSRATNRL